MWVYFCLLAHKAVQVALQYIQQRDVVIKDGIKALILRAAFVFKGLQVGRG